MCKYTRQRNVIVGQILLIWLWCLWCLMLRRTANIVHDVTRRQDWTLHTHELNPPTTLMTSVCITSLYVMEVTVSISLLCYGEVVPYSIMRVGHGADPGFLAVSLQVTIVINPLVGFHYFSPGLQLLSRPKRSPPLPALNYRPAAWWQAHSCK